MIGPVVIASNWEELGTLAAAHPGSPAIVDPELNGISAHSTPGRDERSGYPQYAPPLIEYPCSDAQIASAADEMAVSVTRVKQCDTGDIRALELAILQNIDAERVHRLLACAEARTPPAASPVLRLIFRRAVEPCLVADLAADFGVTRRSLQRRCRRLGIAFPKDLLALARVFAVARLLHWSKRPLSAVAFALGFSNDANCYRLLRRVLGNTLSRDMTSDDMDRVEEVILRGIVAPARVAGGRA
ncbi:MAG: helix-turn-helix domain-containing protein [Gemmatimonadetes bacterium]|nr:helix-turn-helix domain-containing protein [Gemmatimonadota bacterium]MCY3675982.1 helix-turn-helix domain-containing protein [Gemmatimonadota bacterium]MYA43848.1 helix-turn-helix transcriptional regulator [Gemmatimonadota bacterium]MYE93378.1 helix-turn-helix transcriptional regulator [Gemmatimonadota bacterium]MYJ12248.1 helix-turn-helix transcriptional regulator [Gemmatimonadota bacterium]